MIKINNVELKIGIHKKLRGEVHKRRGEKTFRVTPSMCEFG